MKRASRSSRRCGGSPRWASSAFTTASAASTGTLVSSLINRAAAAGLVVDGWGIMTFDWGSTGNNQGALTVQAADGLKNSLKTAYG